MLQLSNWVCKPICWKLTPGWMAGRALSARSPNPSAMAMGEICFHPLCSAMPSLSLLQNPKSSFLYNLEAVLRVFVEIHNLTTGVAKMITESATLWGRLDGGFSFTRRTLVAEKRFAKRGIKFFNLNLPREIICCRQKKWKNHGNPKRLLSSQLFISGSGLSTSEDRGIE